MSTKTILITGTNSGLGFHTALRLAQKNYRLILVDKQDLTRNCDIIMGKSNNKNIIAKQANFLCLNSVKQLAEYILNNERQLNVLFNNAGIFQCKNLNCTVDGFCPVMQVNYLAPYLLTLLLKDILIKSCPSRVTFVSSIGAFFHNIKKNDLKFDSINNSSFPFDIANQTINYYNSKLLNIAAANIFAEKYKGTTTCNSFHPGMMNTNFLISNTENTFVQSLFKGVIKLNTIDVGDAAKFSEFLLTAKEIENGTGSFFVNYKPHQQPSIINKDFCKLLETTTEQLLQCFL